MQNPNEFEKPDREVGLFGDSLGGFLVEVCGHFLLHSCSYVHKYIYICIYLYTYVYIYISESSAVRPPVSHVLFSPVFFGFL